MSMVSHLRDIVRDYCPGGSTHAKLVEIGRERQSLSVALAASRVMGMVEAAAVAVGDTGVVGLFCEAYAELIEIQKDALGEAVANSPRGKPVTLLMVARATGDSEESAAATVAGWQAGKCRLVDNYNGWTGSLKRSRGRPTKLYDSVAMMELLLNQGFFDCEAEMKVALERLEKLW